MTATVRYLLTVNLPIGLLCAVLLVTNGFTAIAAVSFVLTYITTYLVAQNCFHRFWSHRQFVLRPWAQRVFAVLGLFVLTGDAIAYARTHRYHHLHADTDRDLHSPEHGLWHAALGWMMTSKGAPLSTVRDLLRPEYHYLQFTAKHQVKIIWSGIVLLAVLSLDALLGAACAMLFAFCCEMLSNSVFGHRAGKGAINTPWFSWLCMSSMHRDHHLNASSIAPNDPGRVLVWVLKIIKALQ